MKRFKYVGKNATRVQLPGSIDKISVSPNDIIEVDSAHKMFRPEYYTYNNFIELKDVKPKGDNVSADKEAGAEKVTKKATPKK